MLTKNIIIIIIVLQLKLTKTTPKGLYMSSPGLRGFPAGTPYSSHPPETRVSG